MKLISFDYDRPAALAYARRWAFDRNPAFYNFDELGGDCTNFASQCLYAGGGVMNYTPTYGWYYINLNERAPAWTGVEPFYHFLVRNDGTGPVGRECGIEEVLPGDFLQFGDDDGFYHTPIIVRVEGEPSPETIFVAAHTNGAYDRPMDSYVFQYVRFLHIEKFNSLPPGAY